MHKIRGVKGATTVESNDRQSVLDATEELMRALIAENGIDPEDLAAVQFTTSPDLTAEFPAVAARERLGWVYVPLMCGHEMAVPHGQQRCVRILMLWNTERSQKEIRHVYMKEAASLRPDLAKSSTLSSSK
ncbi:MAG: chorismate mutase [Dehalococcoidia bacterium]